MTLLELNTASVNECPFPFVGGRVDKFTVYNDGSHYIAVPHLKSLNKRKVADLKITHKQKPLTEKQQNMVFNGVMRERRMENDCKKLYLQAREKNLRNLGGVRCMTEFILAGMLEKYENCSSVYVERKIMKFRNVPYFDKIDLTKNIGANRSSSFNELFDNLYLQGVQNGLRNTKRANTLSEFIKDGLLKKYPESSDMEWINERVKQKANNLHHRFKRFRRKVYLNRWNYFVTFTYDDKKHDEESFKKKLRKCLSNLHTRRGWCYMGVFERAPETGRLHFHGLLYVPDGEMVGNIMTKRDYSTAQGKMQTTHINSFFYKTFGRNDFDELSDMELRTGQTIDYILKYIAKTNERIVYSRGIPTEINMSISSDDLVCQLTDFVLKFILFDDVVDYERDIKRCIYHKQMSMTDFVSHSSLLA